MPPECESPVWDGQEERRIQPIHHMVLKLDLLHRDIVDMKVVLKDLTATIAKLAVIEERQTQTTLSLQRLGSCIEHLEERTTALEVSLPESKRTAMWMDRSVWAGLTVIAVFIAKKTGLM